MSDERPSALTDKKAMGGIIALEGHDYQVWDLMCRVPAWIANPTFEHVMYEGLEDFEARFFAPHSPHGAVLDRFQAKQSVLPPTEATAVFAGFHKFDLDNPGTARVQTLVTPGLPATLAWMGRHIARVRNARPFYTPFASVLAASDDLLREKFSSEFPGKLGEFMSDGVDVGLRSIPDAEHASGAFLAAFEKAFPSLEVSTRATRRVFDDLESLVRRRPGEALDRGILRATMEAALGITLPLPPAFPLLIRSDRNGSDETMLEIDASGFAAPPYPARDAWDRDLKAPLESTARWLGIQRQGRVSVNGQYRLSTAVLIGRTFRSAAGFELEISTKDGYWATDDRPAQDAAPLPWVVKLPAVLAAGDRLVVSIGIFRDPIYALTANGTGPEAILSLQLSRALTSAKDTQASVGLIKRWVDEAVSRLRPKGIDLFYAGPGVLAVGLGHRWNGLPPTKLHEFLSAENRYEPVLELP